MLLSKGAATRLIFLTAAYLALSEPFPLTTTSSENIDCEYDYLDPGTLKSDILRMCRSIVATCGTIHDVIFLGRTHVHATVGLYVGQLSGRYSRKSDADHALAKSVSIFHTFIRPLGDLLTNETVREVVDKGEGSIRKELYYVYGNITVATKIYQLIESDANIHACQVPYLPANTKKILRPKPPLGSQGEMSERKVILDGIISELQQLAVTVVEIIRRM